MVSYKCFYVLGYILHILLLKQCLMSVSQSVLRKWRIALKEHSEKLQDHLGISFWANIESSKDYLCFQLIQIILMFKYGLAFWADWSELQKLSQLIPKAEPWIKSVQFCHLKSFWHSKLNLDSSVQALLEGTFLEKLGHIRDHFKRFLALCFTLQDLGLDK